MMNSKERHRKNKKINRNKMKNLIIMICRNKHLSMEMNIMDSLKEIKNMDMVYTNIRMVKNMMDTGYMIKKKEKESISGHQAINMKESGKMV